MNIRKFEFNQVEENTYLIYDETKEAAIIDCGAHFPEEKKELQEYIGELHLTPKRLLNTHLHMDHAFGNYFIHETYGLLPEYHHTEESMPSLKDQARSFGMKMNDHDLKAIHYIEENDVITVGKMQFKALLIPGHSPGSLCFYTEKNNCVFTGDVLFLESVGRSDLWGGDSEGLIRGIKEKLLTLPDETIVYPGHGPQTTIGHEKKHNPFLR